MSQDAGNESPSLNPTQAQAGENKIQKEVDLSVQWFSRIGMLLMLVGLVYAAGYAIPHLSAQWKLTLGLLISGGIFTGGHLLEGRDHVGPIPVRHSRVFARILQGGGIALGFVLVFGSFFIPELQVFDNAWAGWTCLMAYSILIFWTAHIKSSQTIAMLGLLLGYFTANYNSPMATSFISTTILSLGALFISTRLQPNWHWVRTLVPFGGAYTYLAYMNIKPQDTGLPADIQTEHIQLGFLALHFAMCHISSFGLTTLPKMALFLTNIWVTLLSLLLYSAAHHTSITWQAMQDGVITATLSLACLGGYFLQKYGPTSTPERLEAKPTQRWLTQTLTHALLMALFTTLCGLEDGVMAVLALALQAAVFAFACKQDKTNRWAFGTNALVALLLAYLNWLCTLISDSDTLTNGYPVILSLMVGTLCVDMFILRLKKPFEPIAIIINLFAQFILLLSSIPLPGESYALTLLWAGCGLSLLTSGLLIPLKSYRIMGILWFIPTLIKLLIWDTASLDEGQRILAFMGTGAVLILSSFLYSVLSKNLLKQSKTLEAQPKAEAVTQSD